MPAGTPWPRISIVTPNYNYGQYLEETIRSILLQGYPNLEYIIIDGGSTDESVEIIRKYSKHIAYWTSESDGGQAHAINKGLSRVSGVLLNWINSDDQLLPGALRSLAERHLRYPTSILLGDVENFYESDGRSSIYRQSNVTFRNLIDLSINNCSWHQPGTFIPAHLSISIGPLDEGLKYSFDLDYLCRLLQRSNAIYLSLPVVRFRIHNLAKTVIRNPEWLREEFLVIKRYWNKIPRVNKPRVHAIHDVHVASVYLAYDGNSCSRFFNRAIGMRRLIYTLYRYPRIVFDLLFLKVCLRVMLPIPLFRVLQNYKNASSENP